MANKEKMGPPTLEMIQGNPYNYTFDEVAKCMGEERAKSLFKTLYKNGVSPKNQTMTIKDIYVGGDTTKYAFELQDGSALKQYALKEGLAIRYALALWSVVRWGVFSVHQEKMDLFAIFHQLK